MPFHIARVFSGQFTIEKIRLKVMKSAPNVGINRPTTDRKPKWNSL